MDDLLSDHKYHGMDNRNHMKMLQGELSKWSFVFYRKSSIRLIRYNGYYSMLLPRHCI